MRSTKMRSIFPICGAAAGDGGGKGAVVKGLVREKKDSDEILNK
ncbi:hypothetical protein A2U01_0067374, partial [Trifolium medium]|nr:hypothetical protein [Trifolium medium]